MGTKQSGLLELRFTNLAEDFDTIKETREAAIELSRERRRNKNPNNIMIRSYLKSNIKSNINWSRIS